MRWTAFIFALACSGAKTDDSQVDTASEDLTNEDSAGSTADDMADELGESSVVINEVLAKSAATADWIELYNDGDDTVDLSGYALHDDGSASDAWVFPDGTVIDAGGFLLVWADDVDEDGLGDTQGELSSALHASFKLSKDGETLVLLDASGEIADSVEFPALGEEESYARTEDGGSDWSIFTAATPGASNN